MESPKIRPGVVHDGDPMPRVVAFFRNSALGNAAIQLVTSLGVPSDRLGITPPELIEGGQGMILSIACPEALRHRVEAACRSHGGALHRQPI
ncbi:hypothetical protein TA3x_004427 [Tundrisphaera sp. TA3]|uniref:hypothetical protein n=1 Tax=Tundrisphaera sp. TA3 TaxID=3435775 RepID=UPI003EBCEA83